MAWHHFSAMLRLFIMKWYFTACTHSSLCENDSKLIVATQVRLTIVFPLSEPNECHEPEEHYVLIHISCVAGSSFAYAAKTRLTLSDPDDIPFGGLLVMT